MNDNQKDISPEPIQGRKPDIYLTLSEAVEVLAGHNIHTNISQLRQAASPDTFGVKRLPFFIDPVTGYFLISKEVLLGQYLRLQSLAVSSVLDWTDDGK